MSISAGGGNLGFGLVFTLEDAFSKTAGDIEGKMKDLSKASDTLATSMEQGLARIKSGLGLIAAGGLLAAPFIAATAAGMDFENTLTEVSAITGVAGEALVQLGERAKASASKMGVSASDINRSFTSILSDLGPQLAQNQEELQAMTEVGITLGKTMGGDVTGAIGVLNTAMLQYGVDTKNATLATSEYTRMMNVMAAASQAGSVNTTLIGDAIKESGATAKTANISFEELNAAIQVLGMSSIKGSQAGNALKNVFITMASAPVLPKDAQDMLAAAGIDFIKLADKTLTLEERMRLLQPAVEDTALLAKVFGRESVNAAQGLIKNVDALGSFKDAVTGTQVGFEMADTLMQTLSERMARLRANIANAAISIYQAIAPALSFLADVAGRVASALAWFVSTPVGKAVALVTAGLSALLITMGLVIAAQGAMQVATGKVIIALQKFGFQTVVANIAQQGFVKGLIASAPAAWAAALPFIKIALVIGAAALAYKAVTYAIDSFKKVAEGAEPSGGLLGFFQKIGGIITAVREIFQYMTADTFAFTDKTNAALEKLGLLDFAIALGTWIVRLRNFFSGFFDGLKQGLGPIISSFQSLWKDAIVPIGAALSSLFDLFLPSMEKGKGSLEEWNSLGSMLGKVFGTFFSVINWGLQLGIGLIVGTVKMFQALWQGGVAAFQAIGMAIDEVKAAFVSVFGFMEAGISWFTGIGEGIVGAIVQGIANAWESLKGMLSGLLGSLPGGEFLNEALGISGDASTSPSITPMPSAGAAIAQEAAQTQASVAMRQVVAPAPQVNVAAPPAPNIVVAIDGSELVRVTDQIQTRNFLKG
jgi:TP901 family phage tail tape measure protein